MPGIIYPRDEQALARLLPEDHIDFCPWPCVAPVTVVASSDSEVTPKIATKVVSRKNIDRQMLAPG